MHDNFKFSIIVPARNEEFYIANCLKSLNKQDFKGKYEIIVVDNDSHDNTADIAKKYGATVLRETRKGISNALISGCKFAAGDIIVFTDADTHVPENWLTEYDKIFHSENVIAAGGIYEFYDDRFLARVLFNKILKPLSTWFLENIVHSKTHVLPCANMAVRRDIYEKAGGFSSSVEWGQELDLVRRLENYGEIFFDKNLLVSTSFRRYDKLHENGVVAFFAAINELFISIARLLIMLFTKKTFSAQKEIRRIDK
ncbi:MAG: glycosyl transferase family protein [uncultured bacterium]|nr:MAG: glycosyl transferase family protein [uncultured bacterium]